MFEELALHVQLPSIVSITTTYIVEGPSHSATRRNDRGGRVRRIEIEDDEAQEDADAIRSALEFEDLAHLAASDLAQSVFSAFPLTMASDFLWPLSDDESGDAAASAAASATAEPQLQPQPQTTRHQHRARHRRASPQKRSRVIVIDDDDDDDDDEDDDDVEKRKLLRSSSSSEALSKRETKKKTHIDLPTV